jgi:hypothetical protein
MRVADQRITEMLTAVVDKPEESEEKEDDHHGHAH